MVGIDRLNVPAIDTFSRAGGEAGGDGGPKQPPPTALPLKHKQVARGGGGAAPHVHRVCL